MRSNNKLNILLIIILAMSVAIGCNFSTDSETKSDNKTSNEKEDALNEEASNSELALDTDEESSDDSVTQTSEPVKTNNATRTSVKFAKGKTSASYENAVIRGEQHTYLLGASAGQNMSVSISSLEDNAGFYILSPQQNYVGDGTDEDSTTSFDGELPESGNYKIVVTPTRGNATFKINFAVSAKESSAPSNDGGGSRTINVKFKKGSSSASYSNGLVRGDIDTYILGASGGQTMSVSVSSLEDNAVFDILTPNGGTLATEQTSWNGTLPSDGKYKIIVGGTRGNASYKVNFSVR